VKKHAARKSSRRREENEVKIAAADPGKLRSLLRQHGFRVTKRRVFEQNIVLDDETGSLKTRSLLLRIRSAGKIITCTFKGKEMPGVHKRREEREFRADSLDECLALFHGLGYNPSFRYEKYRTEFSREGEPGLAMLDETPIGVFLELEGPSRWLDGAARDLGFSRDDYIFASYGRLYSEWCAEYGIDSTAMEFKPRRRQ
jgi:adenylate cyclase class 2